MVGRADFDVIKSQYSIENRNTLLNAAESGEPIDAELIDAVDLTIEDEHEDLDGVHDDVLITATGTHFDALTDWLDATDTGRHVHLDRTGDV